MEHLQISKSDFDQFVDLIAAKEDVYGVVRKEGQFSFERIEKAADLCLDYDETILPPKKFFLPPQEALLKFKVKPPTYEALGDSSPRVLIGVHPGDLVAIALLDKAFSEGEVDQHYLARRQASLVIGLYPTRPFLHRFTSSMVKDEYYQVADCMLADLGNGEYGVEVVTDKGKAWMAKSKAGAGNGALVDKIEKAKRAVADEEKMGVSVQDLPKFLEGREQDPVFSLRAERCFSCGSCILVCPTCFCFDVKDEMDLSLQEGRRVRRWDGCVIENFGLAAGGHNFRKEVASRLRHRIFRKGKYLYERFSLPGCVGCGRCGKACVSEIASPLEVIKEMKGKDK